MLALPSAAGLVGYLPSCIVLLCCWLMMTTSALALLEVSLWMPEGSHLISMASEMLGRPGKVISWILYLFIGYASLVAYTAGGGYQIGSVISYYLGLELPQFVNAMIFLALFGTSFYISSNFVSQLNSILFTAMIISYIGFISIGVEHIQSDLLEYTNWRPWWVTVPFLLTAYSFQTMVPSLPPLLHRHGNSLRIAILGGSTITFFIYLIWLTITLGIIPSEGSYSLSEAYDKGEPATLYFAYFVDSHWVSTIAQYFSFFALATSFLGIGLGLFDFLSDGLRIPKTPVGKMKLLFLIMIPVLYFAVNFERAFIVALDTTGGYGDTILSGIIPLTMLWKGLYILKHEIDSPFPWRKSAIGFFILTFVGALVLEILMHTNILSLRGS